MKPSDLLSLLQDIHRDKLALYRRHEAGARVVGAYDLNNTYQYILAREATHLEWLRAAIEELGAPVDGEAAVSTVPAVTKGDASAVCEDDARRMEAFVQAWRTRIDGVTQARHRTMLGLVLGEAGEHQRFFAQAAAGRADLLGRRPAGVGTGGGVLGSRWIE